MGTIFVPYPYPNRGIPHGLVGIGSPLTSLGVASHFPEGEEFSVKCPGAPDTVRWCTEQSGAPDQGAFGMSFALFV
jgi:hypothetical protein